MVCYMLGYMVGTKYYKLYRVDFFLFLDFYLTLIARPLSRFYSCRTNLYGKERIVTKIEISLIYQIKNGLLRGLMEKESEFFELK